MSIAYIGGGVVGVCWCSSWPQSDDPSHSDNAGTDQVGFSPTRQTLRAPSAKHRELLSESYEGCTALLEEPILRQTFVHMDGSVFFFFFPSVATTRDNNEYAV